MPEDAASFVLPEIREKAEINKTKTNPSRMQRRDTRPIWERRGVNPVVKLGAVATALGLAYNAAVDKVDSKTPKIPVLDTASSVVVKASGMPSENLPIQNDEKIKEYNRFEKVIAAISEDMQEDAKIAIPLIAKALKDEGIYSKNVFAYALATAEHESHFAPINEFEAESQAEIHGYEGGVKYAGRGYIQLTGEANYREMGSMLGIDLVGKPDLLLDPEISAKVLAAFFKKNGTAKLAEKGEFLEARATINSLEFESDEEHIWRNPYNVEARAKEFHNIIR